MPLSGSPLYCAHKSRISPLAVPASRICPVPVESRPRPLRSRASPQQTRDVHLSAWNRCRYARFRSSNGIPVLGTRLEGMRVAALAEARCLGRMTPRRVACRADSRPDRPVFEMAPPRGLVTLADAR